ncbi:MAG TPA: cob(I)yrinic acid a,c-diamide adenosyltransferase [Solirubrobacteraceae bacterium]|nr:cob(I)yrinic acid a,c-diamide adenosyltransferase [Solirubrobacteraceae bacterium]
MLARRCLLRNAYSHMKCENVSHCADARRLVARRCAKLACVTINLTRIYTKLGDSGETHLGDMSRVAKTHPRVDAYGTVDELNATLGVALLAPGLPPRFAEWLRRVQNDLLDVGADLSVPLGHDDNRARLRVTPEYTEWLEHACDEINAKLAPLKTFVIPGGTPAAAHLHVARTVCRRAERCAIAVDADGIAEAIRYLNRLSDLLFILARAVNEEHESLWAPGAHAAGTRPTDTGSPHDT